MFKGELKEEFGVFGQVRPLIKKRCSVDREQGKMLFTAGRKEKRNFCSRTIESSRV